MSEAFPTRTALRLKNLRTAIAKKIGRAKYTQLELANKIGCSEVQLNKWENRPINPHPIFLKEIELLEKEYLN